MPAFLMMFEAYYAAQWTAESASTASGSRELRFVK
jgi:hypothetical protein